MRHVLRALSVFACMSVLSCSRSDTKSPTTPSPVAPPAPPASIRYTISGTVRDEAGAPIVDASVFGGAPDPRYGPVFTARTDTGGQYRGQLPAGRWPFGFSKPGYQSFALSDVSVSGDTVLDATLHPGIQLFGTVTERDVGPLDDAKVEVVSGPDAGRNTLTGHPIPGRYFFSYLLPGEFRMRASKEGYDPVEQVLNARVDTFNVDFTLKWAYGSCLQSVQPVLFDTYPSAGGAELVSVQANAGRRWTATQDVPWLDVVSPSTQTGAGQLRFRVSANPLGALERRKGALMIRCSGSEGQNVWVSQLPNCQVQLKPASDYPATFDAAGGVGHLLLHTGTAGCRWEARSEADWMWITGVNSWSGDLDVGIFFGVRPNTTGRERTGSMIVGETRWSVSQQ
jgi:hypothetical protein